MNVFDETDRTDLDFARHGESRFSFLNRSNRPEFAAVRARIEGWFSRYPLAERDELAARFRDKNSPHSFDSAFFELFLHEYFTALGCGIEVHPRTYKSTKRPDFLITTSASSRFYLEAIVATGVSQDERATQTRLDGLYNALNEVRCADYFLSVSNYNFEPKSSIATSKVRRDVQLWVEGLDYEQVVAIAKSNSLDDLPNLLIEHDGDSIKITAIPKNREARGLPDVPPLGSMAGTSFACRTHLDIRAAVKKKPASRYDLGGLPYVVAVECKDVFARLADVERAIYGLRSNDVEAGLDQRAFADVEEGIWRCKGEPINTSIGGIFYINRLFPWQVKDATTCLYHNPWAVAPIDHAGLPINESRLTTDGLRYSDSEVNREILAML